MSADHTPEPTRTRRRGLTTVSVALAVLLAGGGGAYWASTAGSGGASDAAGQGGRDRPAPLVLDGYGQARAASPERGIAPGEPAPGGPVYKASGPLPDGPASAPVYRPAGKVGEEDVAELAKALEVRGEVRGKDGSWTVGGEDGKLTVDAASGAWSFTGAVPPKAGEVSEKEAEEAARPVVEALGLEGAEVDAGQERGGLRIVRVEPRQDGLPVHGWTTEIGVAPGGAPASGNGRAVGLEKAGGGAGYPVMDAGEALAALNERGGRVDLGLKCSGPPRKEAPEPGKAGPGAGEPGAGGPGDVPPADGDPERPGGAGGPEPCGPAGDSEPVKVTGAEFGLSPYSSQGRELLVPSWLFEVAPEGGGTHTVTHPAVEPEFLAPPPAGDGDESTSAPGSPGPRPGERIETATYVEEYGPGDRRLTVHFWGGVCDEYRASAEESAGKVTVRITGEPREPGRACVMVAKDMTVEVGLDEPVGDRDIVDGKGERLPEGAPSR
ncbi:hypothetical protein ACG5V6_18495 [Streptomyces chitinivorans]|uniref:Large membrane protein n=1 Tax=Streptomyces chitinivorans TaxID=1257027 RepID=A0ABW7HWB7_9ACTN|nr:hypothetical protein [Streptomyces chitinivorans]MDH2407141.1 hypothetical protein [Streptomyces chitinivorans]